MIEVENLTKYYGPRAAIRDLNFEVAKGEILGFLGPNGAGKTTTMRILTGYIPPTSGVARVPATTPSRSRSMRVGTSATCPKACPCTRRWRSPPTSTSWPVFAVCQGARGGRGSTTRWKRCT